MWTMHTRKWGGSYHMVSLSILTGKHKLYFLRYYVTHVTDCTLRCDRLEHAGRLLAIHWRVNADWLSCWHWHTIHHTTSMRWRWSNCRVHWPAACTSSRRWYVARHSHLTNHRVAQSITWIAITTDTFSSSTNQAIRVAVTAELLQG